jgi:thrombospondin type 3 repeat protein
VRGWPLFVVFAGCGFAPEVDADAPPDGIGDMDGDGILDNVDNCPTVANMDQHDHDGDGRGDACDKCPHIASATDPDGDGDGIGDACDPQPTVGTDRLVLWNGFYDASTITGWTQGGLAASWVVNGGFLHQDSPNAGDHAFGPPTTFQHVSVATSMEIVALAPNAQFGFCSGSMPTGQGYCCTIRLTTSSQLVTGSTFTGTNDFQYAPWNGTVAVGDHIQLVQNTVNTDACRASQGATTAIQTAALGPTNGTILFYTASAGITFDYLFVVELGN